MDYRFCKNCGALLDAPTDRFCAVCGAPQSAGAVRYTHTPKIKKERGPVASFFLTLLQCLGYYGFFFAVMCAATVILESIVAYQLVTTMSSYTLTDFYNIFSVYFPYVSIGYYVVAVLGFFLFFVVRKKNFADFTRVKKMNIGAFFGILVVGISAQFIVTGALNVLYSFFPSLSDSSASNSYELIYSNSNIVAEIIGVAIVGPVAEEVLFRGIIFTKLKKVLPKWAAIILSAVVFAAVHGNLEQFFYILPLGVLMAYAYDYYDSIFATIAIHVGFNGGSYILNLVINNVSDVGVGVICVAFVGVFLAAFAFLFLRKKEVITYETL